MDNNVKRGVVRKLLKKAKVLVYLAKDSYQSLGATYYNDLSGFQKNNFFSLMYNKKRRKDGTMVETGIMPEKPDYDPHIGGVAWQEAIKGGLTLFTTEASRILSPKYVKNKTFKFPEVMKSTILQPLGWYTKAEHFKAIALYQNNNRDDIKEVSRARRYDESGKLKVIPWAEAGLKYGYRFLDQIAAGRKFVLDNFSDWQQWELIQQALPPNTLSGYPDFDHQTKDNMLEKAIKVAQKQGYKLPPKALNPLTNKKEYCLTIKWIDGFIDHVAKRKRYFPFVALYRTHFNKIRGVFGAFFILKLMGCVISVCKDFGFTKEIAQTLNIPLNEDKFDTADDTKKIFSPGNIPYMSQLNWDKQFKIILDKLPPLSEDGSEVLKVSDDWIQEKFNVKLKPGEYLVNCIGEDFSKYDTGIDPDDLAPLRKHKVWGKYISYVLDCMKYSKCWYGGERISDVLYKSGIPFTSIFGTILHHNIIYGYAEWAKTQDDIIDKPIVLGAIIQSDDSLIWGINLNLKDIQRYCKTFGFIVSIEDSVDFVRDHIVIFLQVLCGDVLANSGHRYACIGNPQTKYVKLAHSERQIKPSNNNSGALIGVWKITDDDVVNAGLAKLSSFWEDQLELVELILTIGKDTPYGKKLLAAIKEMQKFPERRYEPYRPDVIAGLDPHWLIKLDIRRIEQSDYVRLATASL